MRLFVGSSLPGLAAELRPPTVELSRQRPGVLRPVPSGTEHLTLAFLGEVSEEPERLAECLRTLSGRGPISVRSGPVVVFPGRGRPRVVCATLNQGGVACRELADEVGRLLRKALPELPRGRRVDPHVTLARFGRNAGAHARRTVERAVADWPGGVEDQLREVTLFRSTLTPSGPEYRVLEAVRL